MLAKPQKQKLCNSATPPRILVAAGCERQLMSIKDSYLYFTPLATQWIRRVPGDSDMRNRAAFIDMVTSPEYEANEHRRSGVEQHIILSSKTLVLEPPPSA